MVVRSETSLTGDLGVRGGHLGEMTPLCWGSGCRTLGQGALMCWHLSWFGKACVSEQGQRSGSHAQFIDAYGLRRGVQKKGDSTVDRRGDAAPRRDGAMKPPPCAISGEVCRYQTGSLFLRP